MRYHFTDMEVTKLLKSMVVLIDTREQVNSHVVDYLDKKKIPHKLHALSYGDYSCYLPKNEELGIMRDVYFTDAVVIERKASLDELAANLSQERKRFENELIRSTGTKIYLMVENGSYGGIVRSEYRSKYNPKSYIGTLATFSARYGLDVNFVEKEMAGNFIYHHLYYHVREELLHG